MRNIITYIAVFLLLTECRQPQSEQNIIAKSFYKTGKLKDSLTFNSDRQKNGQCFYFNEEGGLDSIVTFQDGKRNGLKSKFFGDYGKYTYEYKNDSLIEQRNYDTLNTLIYLAPLDIKTIPKTTFKLLSNRSYFDQDNGDTISLINPNLPVFNREISVSGALIRSLKNNNLFALTTSKHYDSLTNIVFKIKIIQEIGSDPSIPFRFDTLTIPVK